ncbi:MAG: prephenate dehydrogenase/arogenate dehydrogenase family protein [Methanobacteriaceae archaeon]
MNIAVIGGTKGLGEAIAKFLKRKTLKCDGKSSKFDFNITITGRDADFGKKKAKELGVKFSNNNIETSAINDIIIVSVPIASTITVIKEIAPFMKENSLLIDVCSLKEDVSNTMDEVFSNNKNNNKNSANNGKTNINVNNTSDNISNNKNIEYIPTHPIFGPRTDSLEGQIIVLTPTQSSKKGKWYKKVFKFLESEKLKIIEVDAKEHDEMMAVVQVLTHFSYLATASAIKKINADIRKTREFASPIYNLMVDMISRIASQNPYLSYSIQNENSNGEFIRNKFTESVMELKETLSKHDEKHFVEIVKASTKHLCDIESALGRSDKAISSLTHEITVLKESIGKEIGLRHIYSKKVHYGELVAVEPNFLFLKISKCSEDIAMNDIKDNIKNTETKHVTKLKIANIEILTSEELNNWKIDNLIIREYNISVIFPKTADSKTIQSIISKTKGVVDVAIKEVYTGSQIENNKVSINFEIKTISPNDYNKVEKILKGIGGKIR